MAQIKHKKKTASLAVLAGLTSAGLVAANQVNADTKTEVWGSEAGAGSDKMTDSTFIDASAVNMRAEQFNAQIRNLADTSNGDIRLDGSPTIANEELIANAEKQLSEIKRLTAEYQALKADIQTQVSTNKELSGLDADKGDDITIDSTVHYEDTVANLKDLVDAMKETKQANEAIIKKNAEDKANVGDRRLDAAVVAANKQIAEAAATATHAIDGVTGNLDTVNRAAQDSAKKGVVKGSNGDKTGVIVDTKATQAINAKTTNVKYDGNVVKVGNMVELENEKAKALANIQAQAEKNAIPSSQSANYRDNALANIKTINTWLQKEQTRADNIQSKIDDNMAVVDKVNAYVATYTKKLEEAKAKILDPNTKGSEKSKAKVVAGIDKALAELKASGVKQNITTSVDAATNIDFGDIGQSPTAIQNKINEATSTIDKAVNTALEKLIASNQAIGGKFDKDTAQDADTITKFYDEIMKKTSIVSQVSPEWLASRKIYQDSNDYKKYIQKAIAQTQEEIDGVITGTHTSGNVTLKSVKPNVSAATASAAEYRAQSANGFDDGFGSPMAPSLNINDFAEVIGTPFANSKTYGGAQAVYNDVLAVSSDPGIENNAVFKDIKRQHFAIAGAKNTLLIASLSPQISVRLKDTYAYTDADGDTKTTDVLLTLGLQTVDGKSLAGHWKSVMAPYGGAGTPLYLYYLSVDPKTGQVGAGGGYIPMGRGINSGSGAGGTSGELKLTAGSISDGTTLKTIKAKGEKMVPINLHSFAVDPSPGLMMVVNTQVQRDGKAYASNTPLYVSDIDDGQHLVVDSSSKLDIISSINSTVRTVGQATIITPTNLSSTTAADGTTNLDSQSVLVFGSDSNPGMTSQTVGIAHGGNYYSIDVGLFAPFGVIGGVTPPKISAHNYTIDTFKMGDPSAVAHTEGKYHGEVIIPELQTSGQNSYKQVTDMNANIALKEMFVPNNNFEIEKIVASNTSLVVRKFQSKEHTSSGNSLVVKTLNNKQRTSSATSMVVREFDTVKRTASGNSIVVRTLSTAPQITSSGNSLVVRVLGQHPDMTITSPDKAQPIETSKTSTGTKVSMSVYVDPSIRGVGDKALSDWKTALATKGVDLQTAITHSKDDLKKGVTLAILNADNKTTNLEYGIDSVGLDDDSSFEMTDLAGVTVVTSQIKLVDADANDAYNADGSIRTADVLKNAQFIVQLNTQALPTDKDQLGTLKHEIGHVFGLAHDDSDSLMTTYRNDPDFTGEISSLDATLAAANLLLRA